MFNSIRTRIAISAGGTMAFTLLIAMGMTTNAFTDVNQKITTKVKAQLTEATVDNLKSTALNQGQSISNNLNPVLANLTQVRSIIELSAKVRSGSDIIINQFRAALEAQDKSVFAGYMVWEEKTWSLDSEANAQEALNSRGFFAPFFSPNSQQSFDVVAMESFRNISQNSNGERKDDWHLIPFETGQTFVMEPYMYPVRGKEELITTISQPIKHSGKVIGSLGFDLALNDLQSQSKDLAHNLFDGEGNIIIASWQGSLLANANDESAVGSKVSSELYSQWSNIQSQSQKHDIGIMTIGTKEYAITSVYTSGSPWIVMVSVPTSKLTKSVADYENWSQAQNSHAIEQGIWAGIFAAIIGIVTMALIANSLGKTLTNLVDRFKDAAQGKGDLTYRIEVKGKDEAAQLAHWFNTFLGRIQEMLRVVMETADQVDQSANTSQVRSGQSKNQLSTQVNEVSSLATAINEMSATAQEVANSAVQAATAANQVQINSLNGMERMNNAAVAVEELAEQVNHAQNQTQNLAASSSAIQGILRYRSSSCG